MTNLIQEAEKLCKCKEKVSFQVRVSKLANIYD